MRVALRVFLLALVAAGALAASRAEAYPQFQLSTGAVRCNQCHYAPAGGGVLNGYGRSEAADTIARGGDGAFLHGAWAPPRWLALGGDLRLAALVNEVGGSEPELRAFPMQADLYGRVAVHDVSVVASVGLRGRTRRTDATASSLLVSREHYVMWRRAPIGAYARAGRFYAPFGLRLVEHPAYVRRWLGTNTLEETYNLSGGWVEDAWEVHVTAFTPDFLRPVGHRGRGAVVAYERRFGDDKAAGGHARVAVGPEDTRLHGGVLGKLWLAGVDTLLLGQFDVVRQLFRDVEGADRTWLVSHVGATHFLARGLHLSATVERFDEDVSVSGVARTAASLQLQWYPIAHVEALLYGRGQLIGDGDDGDPAGLVMLQLHYWL